MSTYFIVAGLLIVIVILYLLYRKTANIKKKIEAEDSEDHIYPMW